MEKRSNQCPREYATDRFFIYLFSFGGGALDHMRWDSIEPVRSRCIRVYKSRKALRFPNITAADGR